VTTDDYGRVTAGTTLTTSDITLSLGFTPINKAGDTMGGALDLGSNDVLSAGSIQMAASRTLTLSGNTTDPTGLVSGDKGKTWFNTTSNQIKYWDGTSTQTLGAIGTSLNSLNGQTGSSQTFDTPGTTGTAPTWSSAGNAHTLNIPLASAASVTAGLISNSDYNTFNGKVAGVASGTGVTVSTTGNIATVSLSNAGTAGTYAKVTTDAYGRVSAGTTLASGDITSSLGFTPINKAGDTMNGSLVLAANGLTAGTNQLVLANGNVGIGTTAPGATLDLVSTSSASQYAMITALQPNLPINGINYINLGTSASNNNQGALYFRNVGGGSASNTMSIGFYGTGDRFAVTAGGNVGIGTTAPGVKLSVSGGQIAGSYLSSANGSSGTPINWNSGNIQTTSIAAGTLYLDPASMVDGAGYTLILTNATGGSYTLSSTGYTFMCNPACPVTVTAAKHTIASMIKAGTVVYVSWVKDFQ
jgi:hypothetical protein